MNTYTPTPEHFNAQPQAHTPEQKEASEVQQETNLQLAALFEQTRQSEQVQAVLASSGLERDKLYASLRTDPSQYPVGANRSFDQVT